MNLHDRLTEHAWRGRSAMGASTVQLPFGCAVVTPDLPKVYEQNIVWVREAAATDAVVDAVERIAADAAWNHRTLEVSDRAVADALRDGLLAAGYSETRLVTMVLDRHVVVPPPNAAAAVRPVTEQRALGRALLAEEAWVTSDAILDQFVERERRLAACVDMHAVVAPAADPVSRCLVLFGGGFAEIDEVVTLMEHRRKGWSTAVMHQAIALARSRPHEAVVLVADADDWPVQWYRRLGFTDAGVSSQFRRWPQEERPSSGC